MGMQLQKSPFMNEDELSHNNNNNDEQMMLNSAKKRQQRMQNEEKLDYFDNISIRKAILLSRYVRVLRDWILKNNKRRKSKSKKEDLNVFVSAEFQDKFQ